MNNETGRTIVVVGAGIVGIATALWLQRAGERVVLIDREGPAAGTSFGNAGVLAAASVIPVPTPGLISKVPKMLFGRDGPLFMRWSYLPRLLPFLRRYLAHANHDDVARIARGLTTLLHDTAEQHANLAAGTPAEEFLRHGDYVFGYADRAAYEADGLAWQLRDQLEFRYEEMDAGAMAEYDPAMAGRFGFAVRCPDHGMISDPGAYVRALAEHFIAEGGEHRIATVSDIAIRGDRAEGVIADGTLIPADEVVLTLGAWSGELARRLGVSMPLESERGYHVEFRNPSITLRAPVMVAAGKFVLTPMRGRLRCAGLVEFGGLDAPPSDAPFVQLERKTLALFPELRHEGIDRWMGHRPATSDSLPVIGAAPRAGNVWLGYGHQHVGLTGGPKTGRWLSQLITGAAPNVDLSAYAPERTGFSARR